eukprot:scaffold2705_cov152-Amphora_coffeaeformis.AAC.1
MAPQQKNLGDDWTVRAWLIGTNKQIDRMNVSASFKERFQEYLRKRVHLPELMRHKLTLWFQTFAHQKEPDSQKLL